MKQSAIALMCAALAFSPLPLAAQSMTLSPYANETYNFTADLPFGAYSPSGADTPESLALTENEGPGTIRVFAGDVPPEASLSALRDQLASDPGIDTITYSRSGESWFVISGYLTDPAPSGSPVVFYAKLMLSPDAQTYSAFEITFPEDERGRYEAMVEAVEDNLTRPRP